MEEYRDTGWNDVRCTRSGLFERNGKPIKTRNPKGRNSATIVARTGDGKRSEINAKWLVAKAWLPDYFEGCHVILKDDDRNNVCADNLICVDSKEFRRYQANKSALSRWGGLKDWKPKKEFRQTHIPNVECTIDGVFRKNGRTIKLQDRKDILGRQTTLKFYAYVDGKRTTFTAARVVAQTWSPSVWDDNCVIQYKDGDRRNIHSDNLVLVDSAEYLKGSGKNLGSKKTDFDTAYRYVERAAKESGIAYRYFQTGDFTELNEYVREELFPSVYKQASKYFSGRDMVDELTTEVIGIMYEHVFANRPLFCYFNFCKKLLMIYHRQRDFGYYKRLPNPIVRNNVSQLNLECLCKKYREMKIK